MTPKYRTLLTVALCFVGALTLSACAAGDPMYVADSPAGFWSGMWHGMIAWFTFIIRVFGGDVQVYEVVNNGSWYDFGFLCGVTGTVGSVRISVSG